MNQLPLQMPQWQMKAVVSRRSLAGQAATEQ